MPPPDVMMVAAGARYEGARARRGHVESWFLKASDPRARRAVWLKWTIWAGERAPDAAVAEVWAIAFSAAGQVATKSGVPYGDGRARFDAQGLAVAVDGCTLSREGARGRVETGGRAVAYDLRLEAVAPPFLHFPALWMYSGPWPAHKIASPIPSALASGHLEVNGERWEVDGWPAMVGHNWGRRHTPLYAWGQCNAWEGGGDLALEGLSVGAGGPGTTLISVFYEGVRHDFKGLRSLARNGGAITPRRWRFTGRSSTLDVEGEMWADTEDFVGLFYPNPDGTRCHCLNSKLARAELTLRSGGRERTFRSERAALEIGTEDPHHGVRMVL
jgi:hypothetical protein